jgi:tubulin-specific chaperone D
MVAYARSLPASTPDPAYDLIGLVDDLMAHAKLHITSNSVVVPVLQTFNVLLETDALEALVLDPVGVTK